MEPLAYVPIIILALVHAYGGKLRHFAGIPRSIWLSVAGGLSVGYVFMHLFPELHEAQSRLDKKEVLPDLEHHVYLMALIGLCIFYGVESAVLKARRKREAEEQGTEGIFWLHMVIFAIYNALIGYILHDRQDDSAHEVIFFAVAMGVHFLVNDIGMLQHHKRVYIRYGRWLLVLSLLLGWGVGKLDMLGTTAVQLTTAFIGGAIVLNVLKEELPQERDSKFWAFLLGASLYAIAWQLM